MVAFSQILVRGGVGRKGGGGIGGGRFEDKRTRVRGSGAFSFGRGGGCGRVGGCTKHDSFKRLVAQATMCLYICIAFGGLEEWISSACLGIKRRSFSLHQRSGQASAR